MFTRLEKQTENNLNEVNKALGDLWKQQEAATPLSPLTASSSSSSSSPPSSSSFLTASVNPSSSCLLYDIADVTYQLTITGSHFSLFNLCKFLKKLLFFSFGVTIFDSVNQLPAFFTVTEIRNFVLHLLPFLTYETAMEKEVRVIPFGIFYGRSFELEDFPFHVLRN
jgi:hypothetical protein